MQRALSSGWVGRGPLTAAFERAFAAHLQVPSENIMAIPSATDGLFLSIAQLGLQTGDEVIMPSISFVGAAQAVAAAGAVTSLADVDPHTLNPSVDSLDAARGPKSRAVALIHYGGAPCDMRQIMSWARAHNLAVIEDSACSPASRLDDRACGTFGDFAVWSFDSMKMISTIEGGAIYARDAQTMARLRRDCCLGMSSTAGHASTANEHERWWEFDVATKGQRSLFNDAAAALGIAQLERLPEILGKRERIAQRYRERLGGVEALSLPPPLSPRAQHSNYFYWIQVDGGRRDALAVYLRERGIYTSFRYFPLHRTTLFASGTPLPGADHAADTTLNLPCHSLLSEAEVDEVSDAIVDFFRTA